MAAAAKPAPKAGRVPHYQREIGDVAGYHRTGAHHRESSDLDSGKNGGIGADAAAFSEQCVNAFPFSASAARPQVVHKYGGGTDENTILGHYTIPKIDSGFERDAIAQANLAFDKGVIANIAVLAHDGAFDDVREGPDARA